MLRPVRGVIRILALFCAIPTLAGCGRGAAQSPATSTGPASFAGPVCGTESESAPGAARDSLGRFDGARQVRAWVEMWNSFDLNQVDALFLRDGRVTYFSSEKPGLIVGVEALREHHRGFGFAPGGAKRGSRLWLEGTRAQAYGSAVVVAATWFFQRAGSATSQRGPVTLILVNDGAGCRIAHAHFANDPPVKPPPAVDDSLR